MLFTDTQSETPFPSESNHSDSMCSITRTIKAEFGANPHHITNKLFQPVVHVVYRILQAILTSLPDFLNLAITWKIEHSSTKSPLEMINMLSVQLKQKYRAAS